MSVAEIVASGLRDLDVARLGHRVQVDRMQVPPKILQQAVIIAKPGGCIRAAPVS